MVAPSKMEATKEETEVMVDIEAVEITAVEAEETKEEDLVEVEETMDLN